MLQAMRRNSRHAIIYVLFGILIAAFVISFGPGSRGFGYSGVVVGVRGEGRRRHRLRAGLPLRLRRPRRHAVPAAGGARAAAQRVRDGPPHRARALRHRGGAARLQRLEQGSRGPDLRRQDDGHGRPAPRRQLRLQGRQVRLRPLQDGLAEPARRDRAALHRDPEARDARRQGARGAARLGEGLARRGQAGVRVARAAGEPRVRPLPRAPLRGRGRRGRRRPRSTPTSRRTSDELKKQYDERAFLYKNLDKQARAAPHRRRRAQGSAAGSGRGGAHQGDQRARPRSRRARRSPPSPRTSPATSAPRVAAARWAGARRASPASARPSRRRSSRPRRATLIGPERTERGFELVEVEGFREGDVPLAEAEKEMADDEVRKEQGQGQGARRGAGGRRPRQEGREARDHPAQGRDEPEREPRGDASSRRS